MQKQRLFILITLIAIGFLALLGLYREEQLTFRVATFNVSMYREKPGQLKTDLLAGGQKQISNIAEIIQRVRPDILLLNEIDYSSKDDLVKIFQKNYLKKSQGGANPIYYPYVFTAPSNTGIPTPFDLDNDGIRGRYERDALAFGSYTGQYAMALLSMYPIDTENIRTFQNFLWKDMPGALLPKDPKTGKDWYQPEEISIFRLSSKSHWDVPILVSGTKVHVLASHPTPPVFDGPEDYNGRRNHDEIRFWLDYISGKDYMYDDQGVSGGLSPNKSFVILGDLNACAYEKDAIKTGIASLLNSDLIQGTIKPSSKGGKQNQSGNRYAAYHTAKWGLRADYVLPSRHNLTVKKSGVFWPRKKDPLHRLVEGHASSDHHLVFVDLSVKNSVK